MRKKHYYGVDFDKKREELLKNEVAKSFIEDVIAKADAAIGSSYEALKMSEYMEFYKSGNRPLFERKYFKRRNNASYISVALWLTQDEKYVMPWWIMYFTFVTNSIGVCRHMLICWKETLWKAQ